MLRFREVKYAISPRPAVLYFSSFHIKAIVYSCWKQMLRPNIVQVHISEPNFGALFVPRINIQGSPLRGLDAPIYPERTKKPIGTWDKDDKPFFFRPQSEICNLNRTARKSKSAV